jgi:hypothetical protein
MRPGRYAADDGSFAKSAGGAGVRGLALLALALLIGVVLLNATDADPPGATVSARGDSDTRSGDGGASDASGETATSTTAATTTTTATPAHAPKDVKVIVANASAVKGAAGNAKKVLDPAGFNVLSPANATPVPTTNVYFTAGYERDAAAVATVLTLPGTAVKALPAPAPFDTKGANVADVIGADQASKFAAAPTTGATSTTVAGAAGAGAGTTGSTSTTAAGATTTKPAATGATTSTTKKP